MFWGLNGRSCGDMWHRLRGWALRQSRQDWWLLPLQPIFTLTVLIAGIAAVWLDFADFHDQLGDGAAHAWLVLGITAPLMTLASYWLILRRVGLRRYWGLWTRLGGDIGQFVVLGVFTLLHYSDTRNNEDLYITVVLGGMLTALIAMITRDITQIALTERLAGRIHRDGR